MHVYINSYTNTYKLYDEQENEKINKEKKNNSIYVVDTDLGGLLSALSLTICMTDISQVNEPMLIWPE